MNKYNGSHEEVTYIELEYAPGGELLEIIFETGHFTEKLCRYYFH